MKKRWMWKSGIVLVLILAIMVVVSVTRGPTIGGRSIRSWVKQVNSADPNERKRAGEAFERVPDPIPVCIALLETKPTRLQTLYARNWYKFALRLPPRLLRYFPPPNFDYMNVRWAALSMLGKLGSRSSNAVPTVIALLDETNSATFRTISGRITRFPGILTSPMYASSIPRTDVLRTLEQIGPGATIAVPKIVSIVNEGKFDTENAIKALGQIGVRNEAVIQALARAMSNNAIATRLEAAAVLWKLEQNSGRLFDILSSWLKERNIVGNDRVKVTSLIAQITEVDKSGIQILERLRYDYDIAVRVIAARALWMLDSQTDTYVLALKDLLKNNLREQRWHPPHIASLITEITVMDRSGIPIFEHIRNDKDMEIRCTAAQALWKLDGQTNTYVQALTEMLQKGNEGQRYDAIELIAPFIGQHDLALPVVTAALVKDESFRVRGKAAILLGKLGTNAAAAIPALREALNDPWFNVRDASADALKKIEPP